MAATRLTKAHDFAQKIRHLVETQDFGDGIKVTLSVGVAEHIYGETSEAFLDRADKALYRAKHGGRNCVVLDTTHRAKPALVSSLR